MRAKKRLSRWAHTSVFIVARSRSTRSPFPHSAERGAATPGEKGAERSAAAADDGRRLMAPTKPRNPFAVPPSLPDYSCSPFPPSRAGLGDEGETESLRGGRRRRRRRRRRGDTEPRARRGVAGAWPRCARPLRSGGGRGLRRRRARLRQKSGRVAAAASAASAAAASGRHSAWSRPPLLCPRRTLPATPSCPPLQAPLASRRVLSSEVAGDLRGGAGCGPATAGRAAERRPAEATRPGMRSKPVARRLAQDEACVHNFTLQTAFEATSGSRYQCVNKREVSFICRKAIGLGKRALSY
ncbi:serine/arginine repetitive matrix protein 3-like [Schistocerca nitens]|uniref:serine/arginine repetitive matrix protein 3-like n=1 Tax=Schistocerca nitens TaxID=7011 RepID=UPI00211983E7|nr:serine/arginine repetitive matrix protein 3-like [Schistocerca nitens]